MAPYVTAESAALDLPCQEVGLELAPGACVHVLSNITVLVGADHVAMLLAANLPSRGKVVLALDIGTNTEVSLIAKGRHLACSTASGPAFEGAHIRDGMRAGPGAIEKVGLHDGQILLKTVDDLPTVGLCGSGILDLVAQMRRVGLLSSRGGFASINEIQLAKGATRAGVNILLKVAGVTEAEIDEIVIAGAFGTYLDVMSGIQIGMFPRVEPRRFKQVGNAAGTGARLALLSRSQREKAKQVSQGMEYVELMTQKDFHAYRCLANRWISIAWNPKWVATHTL